MKLKKNFLSHFLIDIKFDWKHQWDAVNSFIDCVNLLYYKCRKRHFKCGGSYIDSTAWIKSKKATINAINKKR